MKDNFTLMIADDDAEDVEIFLRALEDIKYKVDYVIAKDGIEVLKQLNEQAIAPDMIFLDMNMPKIGGLECLIKLRQEEAFKQLPIVIYTTSSFPGEKEKMMQAGASHYLTKEFSFQKIIEQITHVLTLYMPKHLMMEVNQ